MYMKNLFLSLMSYIKAVYICFSDEVSEAMWSRLHGEMMELQDKVYRCISQALCHEVSNLCHFGRAL